MSSASEGTAELGQAASAEAAKIASSIPFSDSASMELAKAHASYVLELRQASEARAKSNRADMVSASDVQVAIGMLGTRRNERVKHLSEIGALLIGAGLSYALTFIAMNTYTFKNAIVAGAPLLVGCALYFYCWNRPS